MWHTHTHMWHTHTHVKIKTSLKKIYTRLSIQVTSKFNFISLSNCSFNEYFCFVLTFIYLHLHICVCHNMQVEVWGQAVGVSFHLLPCAFQGVNSDHWALERVRQHLRLRRDYFLSTRCVWRAKAWLFPEYMLCMKGTLLAAKDTHFSEQKQQQQINKVIVVLTNVPVFGHFYTILVRLLYPMLKYPTETTKGQRACFAVPSVFSTPRQPGGVLQSIGKFLVFLFFQPME